jgi:hypothetical protein
MDPQPNATAAAAVTPSSKKRNGRARVSNDPAFLPKETPSLFAQGRRRRDLVEGFLSALGGPEAVSPVVAMQVRRAAELVTAAEMVRADMLNGQPTDMLALVRLEGTASRAVRGLGIRLEKPRGGDGGLSLARARWEEQREQAKKASEATTAKDTEVPPDDRSA